VALSERSGAGEPLLDLDAVSYAYLGRFPALDDVSLRVGSGESVALLGANGSGKSTLLKVVDGLVFPDRGAYRAFGEPVDEASLADAGFNAGFRSRVGFVFQNSDAQVFSPTVRDEVAFGPLNMGIGPEAAGDRVDEMLELLGMSALADRAPYQLSGGEKKRVAVAAVLVMNPQVLLFDEPTAALDPRTQGWLVELLVELRGAGKTIVVATHDLELAPCIAERAVVFSEEHRLVADAAVSEVLDDAGLLRSVNLVHDHAHHHGATWHSHEHVSGHHGEQVADRYIADRG
jgi:cobalt/nickel transport system ATP-binding protein